MVARAHGIASNSTLLGRVVIDVATPTHASSMSPKEALSILPDREVQCATYFGGNFW